MDDDETVSIVLSKTTLTVDEEGADGETYTVKLSHEPSVEITVTVTGQDQTDLEITGLGEGNTLTFDATTWDDAQTVTVKAREDTDAKNDSVTLVHTACRAASTSGSSRSPRDGGPTRRCGGAEQVIAYGGRGRRTT